MIVVRWCIPDMSGELKDQIRREAYITNEIIIHQEALRAQISKHFNEYLPRMFFNPVLSCSERDDPPSSAEQRHMTRMESLMNPKMTAYDLDLVMHGEHGATGKTSHVDASQGFIDAEKGDTLGPSTV